MTQYSYIIPPHLNKQRIDKALTDLSQLSRNQIQKAIQDNRILLNEKAINSASIKLSEGDAVQVEIIEEAPDDIVAKKIDFEIVFEDNDLLVINKPVGLTVHPGAGNQQDTLVNGLLYYTQNLSDINGEMRPGIVHRLDKDTSGLMVVAKNNFAHQSLADQLQQRDLQRRYKALIWGVLKPLSGTIDLPIDRSKNDRLKMTTVRSGGKPAVTHYNTTEILCGGLFSLLECKLETGRTHQIRVHLSHSKHSIVGDQTYGNNSRKLQAVPQEIFEELSSFQRQALHSYYLSFYHPVTEKYMEFESEIANDFAKILELLRINCYKK